MRFKHYFTSICLGALLLSGCSEAKDAQTISSEQANFHLVTLVKDLNHPWSLEFLSNGEFLVSERRGQLWRISSDGQQKTRINGVPDVFHEGQGGLLGLLLEPDYKDGGWLYFAYAAADANNPDLASTEVARAKLDLRQNRLKDLEVIFVSRPKVEGGNHWGSRLALAKDGTLFFTIGERYHMMEEAQNPENHLGSVIRINPDGSVPQDNPFIDEDGKQPEIFSYGHRNPQGLAIHSETGKIWEHEHGPRGGDEINVIKAGANYGWPAVTFGIDYTGFKISDKTSAPGMEDPILQWTPSIAPSGMSFYTGDKFPEWKGDLFVGALAHRHLRRLELDGEKIVGQEELLRDRNERIRDVKEGPDGYVYILTDDGDGRLIRLIPAN